MSKFEISVDLFFYDLINIISVACSHHLREFTAYLYSRLQDMKVVFSELPKCWIQVRTMAVSWHEGKVVQLFSFRELPLLRRIHPYLRLI